MYLQTWIRVSGSFLVTHIHYHSGEWKYLQYNNGIHLKNSGFNFDLEQVIWNCEPFSSSASAVEGNKLQGTAKVFASEPGVKQSYCQLHDDSHSDNLKTS